MGVRGKKYDRPSGEGKFLVFREFLRRRASARGAKGTAILAERLPRIISGSRGLVFPQAGGCGKGVPLFVV